MKILCCLDGANSEHVRHAVRMLSVVGAPVIALMTVVEAGPSLDLERSRNRAWRQPSLQQSVDAGMAGWAREAAAKILAAGLDLLPGSEILVRQGQAELEIVAAAAEWGADLILISPRQGAGDAEPAAPRSIGHVARFVLDYAACPVLLVRAFSGEYFQKKTERLSWGIAAT